MEENEENEEQEWDITCDRFIGFMDIMGFKEMVRRMNHSDVYDILKRTATLRRGLEKAKYTVNMNDNTISQKFDVRTAAFSDSVILISRSNTPEDLLGILILMSALQTDNLNSNIPTKGAISYGRLTADFDKSVFFGQALIDAFQLQEKLYYYGIVIDNEVESYLFKKKDEMAEYVHEVVKTSIFESPTPFKGGFVNHKVLKFSHVGRDTLNRFYHTVSGETRKYVDNTILMYDRMVNE